MFVLHSCSMGNKPGFVGFAEKKFIHIGCPRVCVCVFFFFVFVFFSSFFPFLHHPPKWDLHSVTQKKRGTFCFFLEHTNP